MFVSMQCSKTISRIAQANQVKSMELAVIVIRTWYVGSEVVLGVGLGPVDGGPGVATVERGEQHVGLKLPQRERVARVEELAEQEWAE